MASIDPKLVAPTLRELRLRSGLSMEKLARALGFKQASSYQRYESEERKKHLPLVLTEALAKAVVGKGIPPITREEVMALADSVVIGAVPPHVNPPEGRLPIYRQGFSESGEARAFGPRPPQLADVLDGYGVYVEGDTMSPRFKAGELVYVDPVRPPGPGDDVVVHLATGQSFIGEFVRRDSTGIVCRQYNPPIETEYRTQFIRSVHLIVAATRTAA
ncbi:MAG TPA: LexA family transcriptional regulator [Stellaceae bacterium]|nr:LexA family transcriptional regulator [Stellaceae bacterium]